MERKSFSPLQKQRLLLSKCEVSWVQLLMAWLVGMSIAGSRESVRVEYGARVWVFVRQCNVIECCYCYLKFRFRSNETNLIAKQRKIETGIQFLEQNLLWLKINENSAYIVCIGREWIPFGVEWSSVLSVPCQLTLVDNSLTQSPSRMDHLKGNTLNYSKSRNVLGADRYWGCLELGFYNGIEDGVPQFREFPTNYSKERTLNLGEKSL